jgi:hypothetical protein
VQPRPRRRLLAGPGAACSRRRRRAPGRRRARGRRALAAVAPVVRSRVRGSDRARLSGGAPPARRPRLGRALRRGSHEPAGVLASARSQNSLTSASACSTESGSLRQLRPLGEAAGSRSTPRRSLRGCATASPAAAAPAGRRSKRTSRHRAAGSVPAGIRRDRARRTRARTAREQDPHRGEPVPRRTRTTGTQSAATDGRGRFSDAARSGIAAMIGPRCARRAAAA